MVSLSRFYNLLHFGVWPLIPPVIRRAIDRMRGRERPPVWIDSEFARRLGLSERIRQVGADHAFYVAFHNAWLVHALELEDRTTARYGIEQRHPFFDSRLIEFVFALPEEQQVRGLQA